MNEKEMLKELPDGWKWVKLGEIFTIERGGSPRPIEDFITKDIDGINWIKIGDTKNVTKYISKTQEKIKPTGLKKTRMVYEGDFLLSNSMSFGRPYIMKTSGAIHDGWLVIRKNENIDNDYLYYILSSNNVYAQFSSLAKGSTVKNLNIEAVKQVKISLPSKSTQQAIVSKIEELFSEIDKGIEQLKTARLQLKTYRQAVLKWAFEGELTNDDVKDGELPEGWKWVKLETIAKKITDGEHITPRRTSEGVLLLSARNIQNGYLELKNVDYIPEDEYERIIKRCNPEHGDILISCSGSIGRISGVPKNLRFTMVRSVALVKLNSEKYSAKYFEYLFQSPLLQKQIEKGKKATAQANLFLGPIKNLDIINCSIKEQNQIVQEIESRLSVADKMDESINQSLQQAEVLRQSVLKKAFEGKLVQTRAEPLMKLVAKEIPFKRKVLAGKIIHLLHNTPHFGLIKFQKVFYVTENFIEAAEQDYETGYLQEAAGPYDRDFTLAFRNEMKKMDWFDEETVRGGGTRFIPGKNVGSLIVEYPKYFRAKGKEIVFVLELLRDMNTNEAELIATLYAVWNNRLIRKKPVDITLLTEDFFRWSPKKKEAFLEQEIKERYEWMKEVKLVPRGFGELI